MVVVVAKLFGTCLTYCGALRRCAFDFELCAAHSEVNVFSSFQHDMLNKELQAIVRKTTARSAWFSACMVVIEQMLALPSVPDDAVAVRVAELSASIYSIFGSNEANDYTCCSCFWRLSHTSAAAPSRV